MTESTTIEQVPSSAPRWLRATGRFAARVGAAIARVYRSVDPDVQRHVAELPLLGLTMLAPRMPPAAALPDDGYRPVIFQLHNHLATLLNLLQHGMNVARKLGLSDSYGHPMQ